MKRLADVAAWRRAGVVMGWLVAGALAWPAACWSQTAQPRQGARPAAAPATRPAPALAPKPAAKPAEPARAGKGWQVGAVPAWVVEPPAPPAGSTPAPNAGGRREQLYDVQVNHALPKPQQFVRWRSVALDAATLGAVSQPQIGFNPAYQTVLLHAAAVQRGGQRLDRLADARIELMRREQRLEQQMIDGTETLLVVLNDVRVGDAVEITYTVEGENPIFEARVAGGMQLAYQTPVDTLHWRVLAPASRPLRVWRMGTSLEPEQRSEGAVQETRLVRHHVHAITPEQHTPPWFKIFPAVGVSEYASWAEVDAWAQRLFALPAAAHADVAARAAEFKAKGLTGAALASDVLRFVQDEVRYFSTSLGESSHRPKPPQQTLAERLGDCKDKVLLLVALLRELGFDARPVLVAMHRNRGLLDFPPGHDQFDHVIAELRLEGRRWLLDPTIANQGLELGTRGHWPYGAGLVVGSGELTALAAPEDAIDRLEYEQRWDLSQPGQPATLVTTMRTRGLAAERWRAAVANAGVEPIGQALAGAYARIAPGLQPQGAPELADDRTFNTLAVTQRFSHPEPARYQRGALEMEFVAIELLDVLTGPPEVQRRMPFLYDQPRVVESRIVITTPRPVGFKAPPPTEVVDRHFRYTGRVELQERSVTFVRRVERRADQVLPADVNAFREALLKARQQSSNQLRFALLDPQQVSADAREVERKVVGTKGWREDALGNIVARNTFSRHIDGRVLDTLDRKSPLAAQVYASRAVASNLLGDFDAGLSDATLALAIRADLEDAREARAVALLGQGKAEDALAEFTRLAGGEAAKAQHAHWAGSVAYHLGRDAEAERLLRAAVERAAGADRDFALIWLYFAAERQGPGRGAKAIEPWYAEAAAGERFSAELLRFVNGVITADNLMKAARAKREMERLNLAEAHFYVAQRHALQGQRDEAQRAWARTVEIDAAPYRETTFARLELARARVAPR
jgi:lipoprotein NlpI